MAPGLQPNWVVSEISIAMLACSVLCAGGRACFAACWQAGHTARPLLFTQGEQSLIRGLDSHKVHSPPVMNKNWQYKPSTMQNLACITCTATTVHNRQAHMKHGLQFYTTMERMLMHVVCRSMSRHGTTTHTHAHDACHWHTCTLATATKRSFQQPW